MPVRQVDSAKLANGLLISAVCGERGGSDAPPKARGGVPAVNARGQPIRPAWDSQAAKAAPGCAAALAALGSTQATQRYD